MKRFLVYVIGIFLLGTILSCDNKAKKKISTVNKAKIVFLIGDVKVKKTGSWAVVKEKIELTEGNEIKTGPSSQCNIVIGKDSFVTVKEKSHLILATLFRDVTGIENNALELKVGKTVLNPKKLLKGDSFKVKTPTAIAAVRGTQFVVESQPRGKMKVAVIEGKVELKRRIPALEKMKKEVLSDYEALKNLKEKADQEVLIVDKDQSAFINNKVAEEENRVVEEAINKHVAEAVSDSRGAGKEDVNEKKSAAVRKDLSDRSLKKIFSGLNIMKKKKSELKEIEVSENVVIEDKNDIKELNDFINRVKEKADKDGIEEKVTELTIISPEEKSRIYVNSKYLGDGRIVLNPVPGAELKIKIVTGKYEDFFSEIILKEGEKRSVRAKLLKRPKLRIVTPVKYSRIYINSEYAGRGKAVYFPRANTPVDIEIVTRGFKKYKSEVVLKPGEERDLKAELEKVEKLERVKWREKLGSSLAIKPVYYKNRLIVVTNDGYLIAMNKDGKRIWRINFKRRIESTPVIYKNNLYVVSNNGNFYSIKLRNGKRNWKRKIYGSLLFGSKPVIAYGNIFLATSYGRVYNFSLDGTVLWQKDIASGIYSTPVVKDDKIFMGVEDHNIYALSVKDGSVLWKYTVDSRMVSSSPVISGSTLFIGCYSGTFYAIDLNSGKEKWSYKTGDSIFSSPVVKNNSVIFGSNDGYLYSLSAGNGALLWKFRTGKKIQSKPSVKGNTIYITSGKKIFAINLRSGRKQWQHRFDDKVRTSATVVGNDIYLGLDSGEITSVRDSLKNIYK